MLDFIIIGAGFAGAALAKALTDRGAASVALLEQESEPGRHASGKNAAMLRQGVGDPVLAGYIQATRKLLEDPPPHWPKRNWLITTGSLLLGESSVLKRFEKNILAAGSRCTLAGTSPLPDHFPEISETLAQQHPQRALLYTPDDGIVDIQAYLGQLLQDAANGGAQLHVDYRVTSLKWKGDIWQVEGTGPDLTAKCIVNAAGAWAQDLGELAGISQRELIPHRRHLFRGVPELKQDPQGPLVWDLENQVYYRGDGEGLMLSPGDETPHPAGDPEVDPEQAEHLVQKLKSTFPHLGGVRLTETWACLRTLSSTGLPEWGHDIENKSFFWMAGLGGHGVGISWGLAQAAAKSLLET